MKHIFIQFICAVLLTCGFPARTLSADATASASADRWTPARAWTWYNSQPWLVGFNYLPATAVNTTEMWQEDTFDPKTIDEELALAQSVGFNCARVFVQYIVWENDAAGLKSRLAKFLELADKHGIRTMLVLFDDCNFSPFPDPVPGKQPAPRGICNGQWVPSPGPKRAHDRAAWPKLEQYVKDIVGTFAQDKRVLAWETWNEPLEDRAPLDLVEASFQWARQARPAQPVAATVYGSAKMQELVKNLSDYVSFHNYDPATNLEAEIVEHLATGRPVLCTEWLFRPYDSTPAACLPVFAKHRVAALHWGFVNGKTQTHLHMRPTGKPAELWQHDIFRSDRTPFDAKEIALFRETIRESAAAVLENNFVRADFNARGLTAIAEKASGRAVGFAQDEIAAFVGDDVVESDFLQPSLQTTTATNRVYRIQSGRWTVRVIYELQPGWHFLSKQISVTGTGEREFRVRRFDLLRGRLETAPADELRLRETSLLRFGGKDAAATHGLFVTLQNPFGQWKRQEARVSLGYSPDVVWKPGTNAYVSDRLCLGPYTPSGLTMPARLTPEWRFVPAGSADAGQRVDMAEVDAVVECARAFLLHRPTHAERVMVGWCVNDYQIDIGSPEGRTEYKRIIDQAAAVGAKHLLFDPANSVEAPQSENRDAWGWENLLWFTMGQKVRKGEWDPAKDKLPASVQEMVDYAKAKDIRFLAYVYPSLPFMQQKSWTSWVPNGQPGGYLGADTGQRSFQDWLIGKLVDFQKSTGAGGFSFDHWWIAYDETPSSKYAQWDGCRRVLTELRRQIPDVVVDGRQQYHYFGVWTWLAGTYPHPLVSDEQPESFPAFPDLHWSRVSADRQRRSAWYYRQECFVPVEIIPGYMTHQTPRLTEKGECRRDRFRPADWDLLGWKYSVISTIATAPFNLVVNFLPARDEREFKAFSAADQRWFRDWLDWTDSNLEILRNVRPILSAPQLGKVDGTAAFKDGRGFVFLFNPNYRQFAAELPLDQSIGLTTGDRFTLRQLYPDAEKGRLLAPPGGAFWKRGDKVPLPLSGAEGLVLEVVPAPARVEQPLLLGAVGDVKLSGSKLELTGVRGEVGLERQISVALPEGQQVSAVTVNGSKAAFVQSGSVAMIKLRFAGVPCSARHQIGTYDASFAGGSYKGEAVIPSRVFAQLEARKKSWPVDYTAEERAAVWLNSDRLLLFINVAEPNDETMKNVTLKVDGESIPVKPAYTAIVRSNPKNTFTGWYADVSSLKPDVKHTFEVELPKLAPGQFQGLFLDTVEAEYTEQIISQP